jgi:hypothetical protein
VFVASGVESYGSSGSTPRIDLSGGLWVGRIYGVADEDLPLKAGACLRYEQAASHVDKLLQVSFIMAKAA